MPVAECNDASNQSVGMTTTQPSRTGHTRTRKEQLLQLESTAGANKTRRLDSSQGCSEASVL